MSSELGTRLLLMAARTVVEIVGAPVACAHGLADRWRQVAAWAGGQLHARFGETVEVRYFDLFAPDCPELADGAQLPVVLVNGVVLSSGGKVDVPRIRRHIEAASV